MIAPCLAWDAQDRPAALERARTRPVDLVIVGGGITGAGLAREAALRGIPCLLVERGDFAGGTSSRSSKLVHGGMRYLAEGDLRLVRESSLERNWLCAALPNLVRPLPFYYCARKGTPDTPGRVRLALGLYDLIGRAGVRSELPPSTVLSPARLHAEEPCLPTEGVTLAGRFLDAMVDDARLTLEVLKEARQLSGGQDQLLNYVEAVRVGIEDGRVCEVECRDRLGGGAFTVRARCVVNAAGARAGGLMGGAAPIRPTKGVHLVIPNARLAIRGAFVLRSVDDGRTFFALRRGEVTLIGTTDTDFEGDPDAPTCTREDCDYLLRSVNAAFPQAHLTDRDLLSTYAGIRPLLPDPAVPASRVSRRHFIHDPGTGLVTIGGGKLTTFRPMAWELLTLCSRRGYLRPLRGRERQRDFSRRPLPAGVTWGAFAAALGPAGLDGLVPEATLRHLHQQYGRSALRILAAIRADPASGAPLLAGHPFCRAELEHILAFEDAPTLQDVMARRTEMRWTLAEADQADLAPRVAEIMGCYYAWDGPRLTLETTRYLDEVRTTLHCRRDAHD